LGGGTGVASVRPDAECRRSDCGRNRKIREAQQTEGVRKRCSSNFVSNGVIQCYDNSPRFVGGPNTGKADRWMGFPFFGPNQCMGTHEQSVE
jgi:hypothetical protein